MRKLVLLSVLFGVRCYALCGIPDQWHLEDRSSVNAAQRSTRGPAGDRAPTSSVISPHETRSDGHPKRDRIVGKPAASNPPDVLLSKESSETAKDATNPAVLDLTSKCTSVLEIDRRIAASDLTKHSEHLRYLHVRLQELGAKYYRLEDIGDGKVYSFVC